MATLARLCSDGAYDKAWFEERVRSADSAGLDEFRELYMHIRDKSELGLPPLVERDERVRLSASESEVKEA